jgi:hypothetical protein
VIGLPKHMDVTIYSVRIIHYTQKKKFVLIVETRNIFYDSVIYFNGIVVE